MAEQSETAKTLRGWEIVYSDGSRFSSAQGDWRIAPAADVQIVVVWYTETYQTWRSRLNDMSTTDGAFVTENYKTHILGHDFYWLDRDGTFNGGTTLEVPNGLPNGSVKTGALLPTSDFTSLYNTVRNERQAP